MSARDTLTPELRAEVLRLEDDLRARVASIQEVQDGWVSEYDAARAAERTAAAWEAWVDERVTLAAVAWVLTTVFIRFCEDNALVKPVWISGPRHREAIDAQQQFLRKTARTNADVTDREWLLQAVTYLRSLPATAGLVDDTSPMWLVTPSGDAATRLLNFWRERDDSGVLLRDLADPDLDTRFLGDLYQEISEDAKKRYALLQTPVFVEEFILDRTLEPALNERPLEGFKMIDPTCGSGHFLLGGFRRLLDRWHKHAPGLDERERVQAALDSVYGVDINPFAVAVARFRLTVAALQACRLAALEDAPAFMYHLAVGDSLLHGGDQLEFDFGVDVTQDRVAANFAYATENLASLRTILRNGQYDVVVGNPPYIQVKDRALNDAYRVRYPSCSGKYALTVPFMERFFGLAKAGDTAGWTGQITSNSFMKREFGSKLVEKFLPSKDLRLVADTSGAYIPGHGTPTVIIVGRNTRPSLSTTRVVLGVRGEPGQPGDPTRGKVWSSITGHVDEPGWEDQWVTVADLDRGRLSAHPWSLTGGGAVELSAAIDDAKRRSLSDIANEIGVGVVIGEEEGFEPRPGTDDPVIPVVTGEFVRDYSLGSSPRFWPYDANLEYASEVENRRSRWPFRTSLRNYVWFGKTRDQLGNGWLEYGQLARSKARVPRSITFAFVASHNHFVLDLGGKMFERSAPVIKLPIDATDDDHFALLGVLNSSTACFWMKQNSYPKGGDPVGDEGARVSQQPWSDRYEFTSTTIRDFPLPATLPVARGRSLHSLASRRVSHSPLEIVLRSVPSRTTLDAAKSAFESLRGQLISHQEELDWEVYYRWGLTSEDLTYNRPDLPELTLGQRAFEIVLARRVARGDEAPTWFERHGSRAICEVPSEWPSEYKSLVERRMALIEENRFLRLLESPDHKRRWAEESWEKQEERALRSWLLRQLQDPRFWFDAQGRPVPRSLAVLADEVVRNAELAGVLALWEGRFDIPAVTSLERLLATEAVPYLAAYRYKDSGLRKRAAWEQTWKMQRLEDAGLYNSGPKSRGGNGPIAVPPRYVTSDFKRQEYWAHRGKLDVPKEPFILYPGVWREGDISPVIGSGAWNHAQQALSIATLIQSGEQQAWSDERLTPLIAGLAELLPWVEQWHSDPDPLYGGSSPAEFFSGLLDSYMAKLGATRESLAAWRPPAATRGRKAKS